MNYYPNQVIGAVPLQQLYSEPCSLICQSVPLLLEIALARVDFHILAMFFLISIITPDSVFYIYAKVGHIGMYRDPETHEPVDYYCKLPSDLNERDVFVVDPMLATGGSAIDAVEKIKKSNPRSIKFLCIIAAPEGIEAFTKAHPDVKVYCAGLDEKLNDHAYILPGLGDAGDRIFGTK